jgi:hypothetical protein
MYNGWKSKQAWNVALWINNDETLWHEALECVRWNMNPRRATRDFCKRMHGQVTGDGVAYTFDNVIEFFEVDWGYFEGIIRDEELGYA